MLKTLLYVYILLTLSHGFLFEDNQICHLNDFTMHCECKNRENITLVATVHFDIKNIKIEGCGTVLVPLGAIPHLQLEEIVFGDINELHIRPFALIGMQTLHTLKIYNIKKLTLSPHGFVGVMNVENVFIKNVVSKQVLEVSFGGVSSVEKFLIEDSYFGDVQSNAFILSNITLFSIRNCTFDNIDSNAFLIHTAKDVIFSNCDFQNATYKSICLSSVYSLKFDKCFFGILEPNFIETTNLHLFKFEECEVSELKTNAFALVDASKKISFTKNLLKLPDEHSLHFGTENFTSEDVDIKNCCNYFTCDCNIYWLWEHNETLFYQSLLNKSYCIGENNTYLSDMVPILDSHDNCKTLEKKMFVNTDSSNSTKDSLNSIKDSSNSTKGSSNSTNTNFIIYKIGAMSSSALRLIPTYSFLTTFLIFVGIVL